MNEELKIVIKGITDDIEKKLADVKKELDRVGTAAKENGDKAKKAADEAEKKIDDSMKSIGKSITVAIGVVVGLTTALVALGKSSLEFQKAQARLVSGFQAMGSNAEQATSTYKELYSFLGDTDTAVEASNLLAKITTEEKKLTEWTNILKGAYASFPDSLPVEALAEASNETIKTGVVTGNLADAVNWLGVSEDAVNQKLASLNSEAEREAYLRELLTSLYGSAATIYDRNNQSIMNMNKSQADLDIALAQATAYITPLLSALATMAATLLQLVKPALEVVVGLIIVLVGWITAAAKAISQFFGGFKSGGSEAASATNDVGNALNNATTGAGGLGNALNEAAGAAKELKKQTMGFDELNVVSDNSSAGGGAGGGGVSAGGVSMPNIEIDTSGIDDFKIKVEDISKELEGIAVLLAGVAVGLLAWKLTNFIKDLKTSGNLAKGLKDKFKQVGGVIMIAAGAMLLMKGYSDAWANGIDWANLLETLGGMALIVGGLALAFGSLAASIGLVISGVLLIVLGIKDLIENGYSMEAVITITIGVLGVLIGVIWAFNSALLANPIVLIVEAIILLVGVFVILWNECDGFRQFWIDLWETIKSAFLAVWEWLKQAALDIAQFFVDAWEAIKDAFSAVGEFFAGVWQAICDAFNAVVSWFSGIFADAWQGIKDAFNAVGEFFSGIWDDITGAFDSVITWFSDLFTDAWEAVEDAFDSVGEFFTGIWEDITEIFSTIGSEIGDAVSTAFSSAVNWVLETAIGIINGFISAINAAISVINYIPGVEISKIKKLEVPQLAKGGIVDSATLALIGERGKEAVVPLENNTEWIDKLAATIAEKNASSTPSKIVLMLDSKELGWANIHSINDITKQTGSLQLTLV